MMFTRIGSGRQTGASRFGFAVIAAVAMASVGAWASPKAAGVDQERTKLQAKAPMPDNASVSRDARKTYSEFWKKLPRPKADALEHELNALEARQERGDSVDRELEQLKREYPGFFQLSGTLQGARWMVASSGGATATATCTGLGWIGRNGRLRCLGRLTAG